MCNLAGYVGERDAAPILIEIAKRQEGFAGGYYSGIATLHEGKIYYAKLTGGIDRLEALTNAASLPGKIGIIHSRSKSGGGDEWAHPFVALDGGIPRIAYVAQGSTGIFKDRKDEAAMIAESLKADGYEMLSRVKNDSEKYTAMSDGYTPHMSDVMCQLIYKHMKSGKEPYIAMEDAFCEMPSEITGLLISVSECDSISWSHIDQPLYAGFSDHGAYIGNTSIGFPDDVERVEDLHSCAGGKLFGDHFECKLYNAPPMKVDEIDDSTRNAAQNALCEALRDSSLTTKDVTKVVKTAIAPGSMIHPGHLTYEVLQAIDRAEMLKIIPRKVEGVREGLDCVKFYMTLK